jgi:hypothetical protein
MEQSSEGTNITHLLSSLSPPISSLTNSHPQFGQSLAPASVSP